MKALIIEDEPQVAQVFRTWFEKIGFEVDTVSSKAQAMESLGVPPPPEVITVDLNLTDIRGDETIAWVEEIRKASPDALLLVISGILKPTDGPRLLKLGADGSFEKMDVTVEKSWWQKILDTISGVSNQTGISRNLASLKQIAEKVTGVHNATGASLRIAPPPEEVAEPPKQE